MDPTTRGEKNQIIIGQIANFCNPLKAQQQLFYLEVLQVEENTRIMIQ
jgi:hypothetical protein